jgi:hypothetical protein
MIARMGHFIGLRNFKDLLSSPVRCEDEGDRRDRACLCRCHGRQAPGRHLPAGRQVRQILDHLGLASTPPSLRAPPDQPDGGVAERPRGWAYEPLFDDLPIPDALFLWPEPRSWFAPVGTPSPRIRKNQEDFA